MEGGRPSSIAVVNAYKAYTGSSSVARSYYEGLRRQQREVKWYQCVYTSDVDAYDHLGAPIEGYEVLRDDLSLVLNSLLVFPWKVGRLKESVTILTDPVLLRAAPRLRQSILIVHDLREFVRYRRSVAAGAYFRWLFQGLDGVKYIICDSDATRTELLRFYTPNVPVDVIHPCSGVIGRPAEHADKSLERISKNRTLNLLYITADRTYKNVPFFCRLAKLLETARDGWSFKFRLISRVGVESAREIARLHPSNLEVIPAVSDVTSAYEWADVLVHPSLVEGFGLPPVEAMQFGIPIVASDIPCLREVVGPGGMLVDSSDPGPWIEALNRLVDPDTYLKWAEAAADRGKLFTTPAFEDRLRSWVQKRLQ
jgi:glycosyltransferase involved in cell wall biosynthesis